MNIEQITDIAYEIVNELEPQRSFDVFEVSDSQIIFQDERGLFKVCLSCFDESTGTLKAQIKVSLSSRQ